WVCEEVIEHRGRGTGDRYVGRDVVVVSRGIHRSVLGDTEDREHPKEERWRRLRDPAQRGRVTGRGGLGRSSAFGELIDEFRHQPVPTDADGHGVCDRRWFGGYRLRLR